MLFICCFLPVEGLFKRGFNAKHLTHFILRKMIIYTQLQYILVSSFDSVICWEQFVWLLCLLDTKDISLFPSPGEVLEMWRKSFWMPVSRSDSLKERAANMYRTGLMLLLIKAIAPATNAMVCLAASRLSAILLFESSMARITMEMMFPIWCGVQQMANATTTLAIKTVDLRLDLKFIWVIRLHKHP